MTPVLSLNVLIVCVSISISFLNSPYIFVYVQQAVHFVTGFIIPTRQTDYDIYNYHHKHQGCLTISLAIICQLILKVTGSCSFRPGSLLQGSQQLEIFLLRRSRTDRVCCQDFRQLSGFFYAFCQISESVIFAQEQKFHSF